jgi:preprotein translocase subunit YajC
MMFTALAYAMGARGEGGGGAMASLVPILIRPQQKQVKRHRDFVRNLKVGERVVTSGGMHGIVRGLTETTVTLEIADNVRIKVTRSSVTGSSLDAAAPEAKGPKE